MGELKTIWIKRFKGGPMDETAGAYGDVVEWGEIRLGDTVELEDVP